MLDNQRELEMLALQRQRGLRRAVGIEGMQREISEMDSGILK